MSKLTALWRLLLAHQWTITVVKGEGVHYYNHFATDLATAMTIAIASKVSYNSLLDTIEAQATEAGDLHTLQALQEAIERVNDVRH